MQQMSHLGEKPILPLLPVTKVLDRSNSVTFKLRMNPAQADSATYEMQVPILKGTESVREVLDWKIKMLRVFTGMGATTGPNQQALIMRTLADNAETTFAQALNREQQLNFRALRDAARDAAADEAAAVAAVNRVRMPAIRENDVTRAINAIVEYMTPYKGLQRQKRWMRRRCRKPADMTAREFFNHFNRINELELQQLPPDYHADQALAPDEVADILLHAFPASWGAEMEKQGFDPFTKTPQEILEFVERLEVAEQITNKVARGNKPTSNNSSQKKSSSGGAKKGTGTMFCHIHGKNSNHSTDQCRTIKGMKKKGENFSSEKKGNKTWTRKAENAKFKSNQKKDLAALMRKTVREELNAMSKDKKDDDSVESVHHLDKEIDPASLNYENMERLDIDDADANMSVEEEAEA